MIEIESSKSGFPTARLSDKYMHSAYSPVNEAVKFFKKNKLENYSTFILIEPCLNYLAGVIKKNIPNSKIISIHFVNDFFIRESPSSDFSLLVDSANPAYINKIREYIKETDVEGLKIISWPPSLNHFTELSDWLKSCLWGFLRELHGNITTTSGFGKRMFSNYIKNFSISADSYSIDRTNHPVVVAGSGPNLENDIDFIKKNRDRFILLALPSALHYLRFHEIRPNLIISTDPGYWAKLHLAGFESYPLILPYSASVPHTFFDNITIPVSQNYFLDAPLLCNTNLFINLPSNGTVAGSALFYSFKYSSGPVFLSGLDFSFIDLLSHVRPHSFENFIEQNSSRTFPLTDIYYRRNIINSKPVDESRRITHALKVYSGWFAANSSRFSSRVFFLNYHTKPPGSFTNIGYKEAEQLLDINCKINLKKVSNSSLLQKQDLVDNCLRHFRNSLTSLLGDIKENDSGMFIFNILNNPVFNNLFLPELLEFKRHYSYKTGSEVQNKAYYIIDKALNYLSGFNLYDG